MDSATEFLDSGRALSIPRIPGRKPKNRVLEKGRPAPEVHVFRGAVPLSGKAHALKITVARENPKQHPWTGVGFPTKFAVQEAKRTAARATPPYQGVHLALEAGAEFFFDASKVPSSHLFYLTKDSRGGVADDRRGARTTPLRVNKKTKPSTLSFVPSKSDVGAWTHFYQCAVPGHQFMGGPVSVYEPGNPPVIVMVDPKVMVTQSVATGDFTVHVHDDGSRHVYKDLRDVLRTLDLVAQPLFGLGDSLCKQVMPRLYCAAIRRRDEGDVNAVNDLPSVLMYSDGATHCNHVHTVNTIRTWLTEGEVKDADRLCPSCAKKSEVALAASAASDEMPPHPLPDPDTNPVVDTGLLPRFPDATARAHVVPYIGKRKVADDNVQWLSVQMADREVDNNIIDVSVWDEDADLHPWAGLGEATKGRFGGKSFKKFALGLFDLDNEYIGPRQGIKIFLPHRAYIKFDISRVPDKHAFFLTGDEKGGKDSDPNVEVQPIRPGDNSDPNFIFWRAVPPKFLLPPQKEIYYQCRNHTYEGGPLAFINPATNLMFYDAEAGAYVAHNTDVGTYSVQYDSGAPTHVFRTLTDALTHLKLEVVQRSFENPSSDTSILWGHIVHGDNQGVDNFHDFTPTLLMNGQGEPHCNHIHTRKDAQKWLLNTCAEKACPKC